MNIFFSITLMVILYRFVFHINHIVILSQFHQHSILNMSYSICINCHWCQSLSLDVFNAKLLETLNDYAGLNLIAFIGIMDIGSRTLNLLYAKILGGMNMANKTLTELTVGSILSAGLRRAFFVMYAWNNGIPVLRCRRFKSLTLLIFYSS